MANLTETQAIEAVYLAADALLAAFNAVQRIPFGYDHKPSGLGDLLDAPLYLGDLDVVAKALKITADDWQAGYEDREAQAAEEADRNRANPLSLNYRAYT